MFQNLLQCTSEYIDFKVSRYDQEILFKIKPNVVLAEDNLEIKLIKEWLVLS